MEFCLCDEIEPEASLAWGDLPLSQDCPIGTVLEDRHYILRVSGVSSRIACSILVGDERLEVSTHVYTEELEFEKSCYFESASGPTDLTIQVKDCESGKESSVVVRLYVIPSKIGADNYKFMLLDMFKVCRALTTDLIGKSHQEQDVHRISRVTRKLVRTNEEELRSVLRSYYRIAPCIEQIKLAPKTRVCQRTAFAMIGQCRCRQGILSMMKRGVDPRCGDQRRKVEVRKFAEDFNVPEHRLLKSFLGLMVERVRLCCNGICREIDSLYADKDFRSRLTPDFGVSLFEKEDLPRIVRLKDYLAESREVFARMNAELKDEFWEDVTDEFFIPNNDNFVENEYYLKASNVILHYLLDEFHWGGVVSSDFMAKKSSRLYEQWSLVQLVSAFQEQGLEIETWDEVIDRSISNQFGLDFKKNTLFRGRLCDGYLVSIRYEPWILPRNMMTTYQDETLCHRGADDVFWNPDIVIELQADGAKLRTIYAIALDAKYSRDPSTEMRQSVSKYSKIRSRDNNQVTHQVWMIYPGALSDIDGLHVDEGGYSFLPSSGIIDDDDNGIADFDDTFNGTILAKPSVVENESGYHSADRVRPKRVFVDFASGTLSYFRCLIRRRREHGEM